MSNPGENTDVHEQQNVEHFSPLNTNVSKLLELHAELKEANEYCYLEIAYTRCTAYMAWITDRPARGQSGSAEWEASRKVLAKGQGETADEACKMALQDYEKRSGATVPS